LAKQKLAMSFCRIVGAPIMYIIKTRGFPEEHKKRLNEPHKGKQTSEESRSKMSETGKDEMDNEGCEKVLINRG
jgi:hypothetical protein